MLIDSDNDRFSVLRFAFRISVDILTYTHFVSKKSFSYDHEKNRQINIHQSTTNTFFYFCSYLLLQTKWSIFFHSHMKKI